MLDSRLTIKHLKMIHAIDAAETLTRAAELLHISQPALSSRLQDAEEILNTRLFHRQGRKLRILPAGQLLLRSARKILKALSDVENELAHLPGHAIEAFRIGMPQYASYAWLPTAIRAFEHTFPSSSIEIVSEAAVHPRQALQRREVDIALVSSPAPKFQDRQEPISMPPVVSRRIRRSTAGRSPENRQEISASRGLHRRDVHHEQCGSRAQSRVRTLFSTQWRIP